MAAVSRSAPSRHRSTVAVARPPPHSLFGASRSQQMLFTTWYTLVLGQSWT